jgi:catechol 2,3-dioxygenase-like lactoylglutathione lyase family enzyme
MLEHTTLHVNDLAKSAEFYTKALAPLGYARSHDFGTTLGFAENGKTDFLITGDGAANKKIHIAFSSRDKKAVDAFYQAAMEAGAKDNGPPGPREEYGYAAFVFDPDGNNIEAVTFEK